MTQDPYFQFIQSISVPVITAIAGAAIAAFQDWRVRRSLAGRREATLADARAQVAFVTEWWQASRALGLSA